MFLKIFLFNCKVICYNHRIAIAYAVCERRNITMNKKFLAIISAILAFSMLFSLAGCQTEEEPETTYAVKTPLSIENRSYTDAAGAGSIAAKAAALIPHLLFVTAAASVAPRETGLKGRS